MSILAIMAPVAETNQPKAMRTNARADGVVSARGRESRGRGAPQARRSRTLGQAADTHRVPPRAAATVRSPQAAMRRAWRLCLDEDDHRPHPAWRLPGGVGHVAIASVLRGPRRVPGALGWRGSEVDNQRWASRRR